ncbi:MAG TPA: ester cyclase [Candidatus Dormibacteraeota bacterium]
MPNADARDVVQQYLEAVFVRKDFEAVERLVAMEGLLKAARGFVNAFPDVEMRTEHELAEDDLVAVRVSATGTHLGDFRGYAPTGRSWQATASAWYRVTDGQITGAWINWDWLAIVESIGLVNWSDTSRSAGAPSGPPVPANCVSETVEPAASVGGRVDE